MQKGISMRCMAMQVHKEMIESIRALDAAITVLSKHHTPAVLASVAATVSAQLRQHKAGGMLPSRLSLPSFLSSHSLSLYLDRRGKLYTKCAFSSENSSASTGKKEVWCIPNMFKGKEG